MTAIHTRNKVVIGKSGGKRLALAAIAAVLGGLLAHGDVTLSPGETLDWDAEAPASSESIAATGGTIVFNSNVTVENSISLGGEVMVSLSDGQKLRLKVKPGTQPGTKVRLRGKGQGGTDLILTYNVTLPTSLSDRQRELLMQMRVS